jgi:hypothetical protein
MFEPIIRIAVFKPVYRIAAATLVAGAIAFAVTAAPAAVEHEAKQGQDAEQPQTVAKADRLRVPVKGTACSAHAWPNFEPKCQFDAREPAGEARTVRVIALR